MYPPQPTTGSGDFPGRIRLAKQFEMFRQYFYFAANLNLDVCFMLRRLISLELTVRIRLGFSSEVDNRRVRFFRDPDIITMILYVFFYFVANKLSDKFSKISTKICAASVSGPALIRYLCQSLSGWGPVPLIPRV